MGKGKKRALGWLHGEQAPTGRCAPDEQEARMAEDFGGEVHRRSGAGMVKHDGHNDLMWWDAKHTDGRSISLPISFLDHLYEQAVARGKLAVVELEFSQARGECRWYLVPWEDVILGVPGNGVALGVERRIGGRSASIGIDCARILSSMVEQNPAHVPAVRFEVLRCEQAPRWGLVTRDVLGRILAGRSEGGFTWRN
jgi:hypothetical protein